MKAAAVLLLLALPSTAKVVLEPADGEASLIETQDLSGENLAGEADSDQGNAKRMAVDAVGAAEVMHTTPAVTSFACKWKRCLYAHYGDKVAFLGKGPDCVEAAGALGHDTRLTPNSPTSPADGVWIMLEQSPDQRLANMNTAASVWGDYDRGVRWEDYLPEACVTEGGGEIAWYPLTTWCPEKLEKCICTESGRATILGCTTFLSDELAKAKKARTVDSLASALSNSEVSLQLLEVLAENSFDSILITDAAEGNITYANKAFTILTGYEAADVHGKSPKILQGEGTDKKVISRLNEALKCGGDFEGKAINFKKDGTPFIMYWRVLPVKVGGETKAWVAIQREGSHI